MVALWPNPLTFLLAVAIIGSRQLGLAILMHDGAHGALANGAELNMALSQWFCAYPIFAETRAYRRYHLQHHAHTQQDDDPDLVLSAPFPITKASYRRKFWRDITRPDRLRAAQGAVPQRARRPVLAARARRAAHFWEKLGPQCVANAVLFAGLAAAGVWWAYPLLWLLPLLTWMMVITRIRNIAEHAVVPDSDDPLRNTRTTRRASSSGCSSRPITSTITSNIICCSMCPATTCRACTEILLRGPHAARMEVQPSYAAVLRLATARPPQEDRPGKLVNSARRARTGAAVDDNQAASGF